MAWAVEVEATSIRTCDPRSGHGENSGRLLNLGCTFSYRSAWSSTQYASPSSVRDNSGHRTRVGRVGVEVATVEAAEVVAGAV